MSITAIDPGGMTTTRSFHPPSRRPLCCVFWGCESRCCPGKVQCLQLILLCSIPVLQCSLLIREYAGRLPVPELGRARRFFTGLRPAAPPPSRGVAPTSLRIIVDRFNGDDSRVFVPTRAYSRLHRWRLPCAIGFLAFYALRSGLSRRSAIALFSTNPSSAVAPGAPVLLSSSVAMCFP